MKRLFLFTGTDFFEVVADATVFPGLLGIIVLYDSIEQFIVNGLDRLKSSVKEISAWQNATLSRLRSLSTFFAENALVLWLTEPFPSCR
jgi:hypothetical protein